MFDESLYLKRVAGLRLDVFNIGQVIKANLRCPGRAVCGEVSDGRPVVVVLRSNDLGLLKAKRKKELRREESDQWSELELLLFLPTDRA